MSQLEEVNEEPPTRGKVILNTSCGPLEIELWANEAPKTCRNFIQLCLEGYYEDVPFHRLVPDFLIQGGDPTGTGTGGEAALQSPPPPEFHGQLKWARRGMVGAVAMNDSNSASNNSTFNLPGPMKSQFFFTLAATPELYRRSTLFGRIIGDTIYNLARLGEFPREASSDTLAEPRPSIISAHVLENPFDDVIPRELVEVRERRLKKKLMTEPVEPTEIITKRTLPMAGSRRKLLSFTGDIEEDEEDKIKGNSTSEGIKSIHQTIIDPHLSKESIVPQPTSREKSLADKTETPLNAMEEINAMKKSKLESVKEQIARVQAELKQSSHLPKVETAVALPPSVPRINSLKKLLLSAKTSKTQSIESVSNSSIESNPPLDLNAAYKERRRQASGKRTVMDEMDTLLALNSFRDKLKRQDDENTLLPVPSRTSKPLDQRMVSNNIKDRNNETLTPAPQLDICKLHGLVGCESCRDTFGIKGVEGGEGTEEGWLMHRLVFDKEAGYRDARVALDQLQVIDPRERAQQFIDKSTHS